MKRKSTPLDYLREFCFAWDSQRASGTQALELRPGWTTKEISILVVVAESLDMGDTGRAIRMLRGNEQAILGSTPREFNRQMPGLLTRLAQFLEQEERHGLGCMLDVEHPEVRDRLGSTNHRGLPWYPTEMIDTAAAYRGRTADFDWKQVVAPRSDLIAAEMMPSLKQRLNEQ